MNPQQIAEQSVRQFLADDTFAQSLGITVSHIAPRRPEARAWSCWRPCSTASPSTLRGRSSGATEPLPVIWRAQLVALALVAPFGLAGMSASTFAWSSVLAVAVLGCLGTAVAFVAFTTLVGRVGSTRASVTIYFLPAVAIVLGALFRDETIAAISLLGTLLVTAGAYLTSRGQQR